jgi:hypothetical protein
VTQDASGPYGRTPESDAGRPPFAPGNETAMVHGARSERRVGPLAAQIAAELLADEDCPAHLHEAVFRPALEAWSRAEAIVTLLWRFLAEAADLEAAMTEVSTGEETEQASAKRGKITRRSVAKRTASALDMLRRWEATAASARSQLGLNPASAARMARDMADARRRGQVGATPLDTAVAAITAQQVPQPPAETTKDGADDDGR